MYLLWKSSHSIINCFTLRWSSENNSFTFLWINNHNSSHRSSIQYPKWLPRVKLYTLQSCHSLYIPKIKARTLRMIFALSFAKRKIVSFEMQSIALAAISQFSSRKWWRNYKSLLTDACNTHTVWLSFHFSVLLSPPTSASTSELDGITPLTPSQITKKPLSSVRKSLWINLFQLSECPCYP